jgi:hypothetical protein
MLTMLVIRMIEKARRAAAFLFGLFFRSYQPLRGSRFEFHIHTFVTCGKHVFSHARNNTPLCSLVLKHVFLLGF